MKSHWSLSGGGHLWSHFLGSPELPLGTMGFPPCPDTGRVYQLTVSHNCQSRHCRDPLVQQNRCGSGMCQALSTRDTGHGSAHTQIPALVGFFHREERHKNKVKQRKYAGIRWRDVLRPKVKHGGGGTAREWEHVTRSAQGHLSQEQAREGLAEQVTFK